MKTIEENFKFRVKVQKWLIPLGYEIVWSENHPTPNEDVVHFYGNGLKYRIVCEKRYQQEYFYFIYEFPFITDYFALKSKKYKINTCLETPIKDMNKIISLMPNNLYKKSFIEKIKLLWSI